MRSYKVPRLLALPLCIAGVALSLSGPQPMCSAPNPSAQLQAYDALLSEPSCVAATVLAREARTADTADSEAEEEENWRVVGRVAASTDAGDRAETALAGAAQRQQRLIVEHACRLHKALRLNQIAEDFRATRPMSPHTAVRAECVHLQQQQRQRQRALNATNIDSNPMNSPCKLDYSIPDKPTRCQWCGDEEGRAIG